MIAPAPPLTARVPTFDQAGETITINLQPRTYLLTITGVARAAEIFVDGAPLEFGVGLAARTGDRAFVPLAFGSHQIAVGAPGLRTINREVEVSGNTAVRLKLLPASSRHEYLATFPTGMEPKAVVFSPDGGQIFVPLLAGTGMDIIDIASGNVKRVEVPEYGIQRGFVEGVFSIDGSRFYLSQMTTAMIHEFAITYESGGVEPRLVRSISTGSQWSKVVALSPGGEQVAVSNWLGDSVSIISRTTGELVQTVKPGGVTPRGLAFTSDGMSLLVSHYGSGEIVRLDTRNWTVAHVVETGGAPRHIVVDSDDQYAYVSDMGIGSIWVYDLAENTIAGRVAVWYNANTIDLSPDDRYLYVSTRGPNNPLGYRYRSLRDGRIYVVRTADRRVTEVIPGTNQPTGLDVSPDGRLLAFSNFQDNTVELYRIDP
jgi:DNA-binding beta-propeller fold protein YncE